MAKEQIMSQELVGRFDVRQYKAKTEKKDQKLLDDSEAIKFQCSFKAAELPAMFSKYAKPYTNHAGEEMAQVTFKVGNKCKWYTPDANGNAIPSERPANEYLDGVQRVFIVYVNFTQLDGDASAKEPSGYWANSILYKEKPQNPFEGIRFESRAQVADFTAEQGDDNEPTMY